MHARKGPPRTTIRIDGKEHSLDILETPLGPEENAPVHSARLHNHHSYGTVAIKVLTVKDDQSERLFKREIDRWKKLSHPHVHPYLGASARFGVRQYGIVSPIAEQGNMLQYITNRANNPRPTRLQLLIWIAEGLQYLHLDAKIVHGDLKCANILMSGGHPKIADFGLSTLIERVDPHTTVTGIRNRNTPAFAAPELLADEAIQNAPLRHLVAFAPSPKKRSKTTHSDVFAFGRLIYEAYAEREPWSGNYDSTVKQMVLKGQIPPRQFGGALAGRRADGLWQFCKRCWAQNPDRRPDCIDILDELTAVYKQLHNARPERTPSRLIDLWRALFHRRKT